MIDIQPNSTVRCTAEKDSILYLGGDFVIIGSSTRSRAAAFDLSTGQMTDFNPSFDNLVYTICVGTTKIAFGGYFKSVSYRGVNLTNLNGIVLYNIAEDSFEKLPEFVLNDPNTYPYPGASTMLEIVYHAGTGVFYTCGSILISFTDYNGIYRIGVTAAFGVFETDGRLIDLGIRRRILVAGAYKYVQVGCLSCLVYSDSLYLGVQNNVSTATAPAAYDIASVDTIAPISTWDAVLSQSTNKIAYMDGNIWMYRQDAPATYYKASVPGSVYTVGHFLIVDPVNAIPDVATSGLTTSTFNPYGGNSMRDMWEDSNYIYLLGYFWGIGLPGFNTRNVLGGIAKISKTTYEMVSETIDLRYYTPGVISYFVGGGGNCHFTQGNDIYVFGNIPQIAGSIRPNPYAPYIINPDFSKKQYAASLLV